jgi:hypothetical protein
MSFQRIVIESPLSAVGFQSVCDLSPGPYEGLQALQSYLGSVAGGQQSAKLQIQVGAVKASGTVTFSSTGPTNGQTCTILGVTFTAQSAAPSAGAAAFQVNATPATVAANLAAAINGYSAFAGIITATSALGVVTVSMVVPGTLGNYMLAIVNVNLSNAVFVNWAGGTNGTLTTIDQL